ncbi:MAG: flavodoxin-dependent (E)-4-hydroxy-3-methylbut-2-enyl-diphosphate synthase, partial [Clostridia bacterium]|nr:flavodoxin-dependent (E)-4-hydroxy-3-methylbut-2-enyl-diphosphate synthase [Clostridia bacterium]
ADIHFDYRLAIAALEKGADKIRFNPGNIGDEARVRAVAACAKMHHAPIRIGVNAGSLEPDLKAAHPGAPAEAMVESALRHIRLLEREGFLETVAGKGCFIR